VPGTGQANLFFLLWYQQECGDILSTLDKAIERRFPSEDYDVFKIQEPAGFAISLERFFLDGKWSHLFG